MLTAASLVLFGGGTLAVDAGGIAEIGSGGTQIAGQLVVDAGVTAGGSGEVAAAVTNQGVAGRAERAMRWWWTGPARPVPAATTWPAGRRCCWISRAR